MTLTAILDVAIGLIFTYLLLGLIATALQEAVAAALQWRGEELRNGVRALLDGGDGTLFGKVFGHALVRPPRDKRLPSYVVPKNFSTALTDALLDGSNAPLFSQVEGSVAALPPGPAKQALAALVTQAAGDYTVLKKEIEDWFNSAMDRVSGRYKRRSQIFAIVFGVVVAIAFNVDTINIASTLWKDPQRRAQIVENARAYVDSRQAPATPPPTAEDDRKQAEAALAQLESLPLPIGWTYLRQPDDKSWLETIGREAFGTFGTFLSKLIGLLATALAVSLGAPFWFDILKKFLNVRAAGPRPREEN
jgi:hypothetical protein